MPRDASELARHLAREAEAVCRHYLSNGKREGRYWLVGDVHNTSGRSLFVRLQESPKGPAGKWTDAATGDHGDLLDIIRESLGLRDFREVAEEARRFLNLPRAEPQPVLKSVRPPAVAGSQGAARRLFAMSQPIEGTVVEAYLHRRGIAHVYHGGSLRFHPRCYYRPDEHLPTETWPAMIACVTDLDGGITGVHRTWLDPDGFDRVRLGKAPIDTPRRAMGDLLGNAVRFGFANDDVLIAGEGIETMLSLRCMLPSMPMAAALSANHLAAMLLSPSLRRLYIARDADAAGEAVQATLAQRAGAASIEAIALSPRLGDFNEDLHVFGFDALRAALRIQLAPEDVDRFLLPATALDSCICFPSTSTVRSRRIQCRQGPRPRPSRGRSDGKRPGPAMAEVRLFSAARRRKASHYIWGDGALCIAKQNSRTSAILRWRFGPPLPLRVLARPARRLSNRHEGRDGRGRTGKGLTS